MSEPARGDADSLSPEDAKLVTLARGAMGRVSAPEGAALRDETGRTYASASVQLPSLQLTALQAVVAQASAAGARSVEAVVVVGNLDRSDDDGLSAVRDLAGGGVRVITVMPDGTTRG